MTDMTPFKPCDYAAVRIPTRNMELEIRRGGVAFLGEPGYRWEGLYSFALGPDGVHKGDVRRVMWVGRHYLLRLDRHPQHDQQVSRDVLRELAPRPVVGVVNPYAPDFEDFLRERFGEAVS